MLLICNYLVEVNNHHFKMKEFENRLITFTQAAHILGYKNYRSVLRLIKEGYLKEYDIPHTKRRRLALNEVMKVAVPESISSPVKEFP